MNHQPVPTDRSILLTYLQLLRLPNVFTAIADVTMGYLFVRAALTPVSGYVSLLLCSCMLYMAGMVLNDVHDLAIDSRQRPQRPLPSGSISVATAKRMGYTLLSLGLVFGWLAGLASIDADGMVWRSGLVATALATCVLIYDTAAKQTAIGPLVMGACRALNVLLGMSVAKATDEHVWQWLGYDGAQWLVAGGIGVYVAGVTVFARREATVSRRGPLVLGIGVMVLGLAMLVVFPGYGAFGAGLRELTIRPAVAWPALVLLVGFTIVRRCTVAVSDPQPFRVQVAVKQCILSLIVLDASVCLAVCQPVWWSVGILALIIPMLIIGRWVYST